MTDRELIDGLFRREESALGALRQIYQAYAAHIAGNILGNPESAEEVCADVWLKIWQSIPPNRPDNLRIYIARLSRNRALQVLESEQAQKRSAIRVQLEELQECLPDSAAGIDADAMALREFFRRFVAELPREKRIIFLRRYYFGDTVPEIAAQLGCKSSRITGILYRTRQELKQKLKQKLKQEGFVL